ncbi:Alpha-farnesene synthase [Handroanthus impetiginosus]|uniref:Alpha-farnesene synthase n=1 Tax=Handroanthus impetiginosus TaxID=429701 RepID=A0A2G9HXI0_9LAMI|nr:Alpha-farnesene synthase [Handroanthus impetiginosus]
MEAQSEPQFSSTQTKNSDFINNNVNDHNQNLPRRTANYTPNMWSYDRLQSLTSIYLETKYKREVEELKEQIWTIFSVVDNPVYKLEFIDRIEKLALSHYFAEEIREAMDDIIACKKMSMISSNMNEDEYLYSTALYFRILRQYGHYVSQDEVLRVMNGDKFITRDAKAMLEISEASYLATEDECLFDRTKAFAAAKNFSCLNPDYYLYSDKCPLHWSVTWFNVKTHVRSQSNTKLLRLAKLSFNTVQAQHQKELKEILRWWRNLGLSEVLTFTRDRVVESFLWAVGVAYEPQYANLRKWLAKAIMLVLIIDDIYDIYGSEYEVEQLTIAVERWDPRGIQQLPEAIKRCFWTLYDTANDIDLEIQKEKGWNSVLPHLKKAWTDFCKALLVEAKWYHSGHTPFLQEYLDNGWISSSGPVLSLHVLFGVGEDITQTISVFNNSTEIIRQSSLIIRLCNDLGTSQAEVERGDVASSILCYMREANVVEGKAREYMKNLELHSWRKINGLYMASLTWEKPMLRYVINTARVANFIYQNGDGFGVQNQETRDQVLSCLVEPLPLV